MTCEASVGDCDATVAANVVTTTAVGASVDCRPDGTRTYCHAGVGVGQVLLDPTVEHWCYY